MPEMFQHRLLRERPLGSKEGDFERFLLCEARRHDFTEEPDDLFVAQWTLIARNDLAEHLRLSLGLIELDGAQCLCALLGEPHFLRQLRALVEKLVNALVDPIDALANRSQVSRRRIRLPLRSCADSLSS